MIQAINLLTPVFPNPVVAFCPNNDDEAPNPVAELLPNKPPEKAVKKGCLITNYR